MRSAAWMVAALCGCGRVGFDARPATTDAAGFPGDAPAPSACTPGGDKDGDGVDDCSDDCPHIADPAQTDTDGDGVGDVCDPHPTEPIDHIQFFDPFRGPRSEWLVETPSGFAGDTLVVNTLGAKWSATQAFTPGAHTYAFLAHVDTAGSSGLQQVALLFEHGDALYYCEVLQQASDQFRLTYSYDSVTYESPITEGTVPLANADVAMVVGHALPELACEATVGGDGPLVGDSQIPADLPVANTLVLQAIDAVVSFEYFIDIRSDP